MTKKYNQNVNDFISPFFVNGLDGRLIKAGSNTAKKENFCTYMI
jgi:hypothetical protein